MASTLPGELRHAGVQDLEATAPQRTSPQLRLHGVDERQRQAVLHIVYNWTLKSRLPREGPAATHRRRFLRPFLRDAGARRCMRAHANIANSGLLLSSISVRL